MHKFSIILVAILATSTIFLTVQQTTYYEEVVAKLMWVNDTLRLNIAQYRQLLYDRRNPKLANTENPTGGTYIFSVLDKRSGGWIPIRVYPNAQWGFYQCDNDRDQYTKQFAGISFTCTQEKSV
ncbi:hypothetical protein KAR91_18155 [Candidatus Pacearchaeota archaeon]|nr:hypothetical protein [Candidatus Pacearchaeota archaeon]